MGHNPLYVHTFHHMLIPYQPESKAGLAALRRSVPLVRERSDFIESIPQPRSGSRNSSHRRLPSPAAMFRPSYPARVGPTTPDAPSGVASGRLAVGSAL